MIVDRKDKLTFIKRLYDYAARFRENDFDKWFRQYRGDREVDAIGSVAMQTPVVRNVTYELIESQVSPYIPPPSVKPEHRSRRTLANAKKIESLCRNIRDRLPFEKLNDRDERNTYIYGGSVYLVEWDESLGNRREQGGIQVTLIEPRQFTPQPHIYDVDDMEYLFVEYEAPRDELHARYGIGYDELEGVESRENAASEDTATVFVCFYRDEQRRICRFMWSGSVVLQDIENYYSRKNRICKHCGKPAKDCRCENREYTTDDLEYEELNEDAHLRDGSIIPCVTPIFSTDNSDFDRSEAVFRAMSRLSDIAEDLRIEGDEQAVFEALNAMSEPDLLELTESVFGGANGVNNTELVRAYVDTYSPVKRSQKTKIPFYVPHKMPIVVRRNTSRADSVFGQSDVQFIRVQQQELNKLETRIQQKLLRAGVLPYSSEDTDVTFTDEVFENGIKLSTPLELQLLGRLDLVPNVQQDMQQAERLYQQAKRILGITDSYQGMFDETATSGRARQIAVEQASGRLQSKKVMKNCAYAEMDAIIFGLTLAYADDVREVTYTDGSGNIVHDEFSRYDFLECDQSGEWYYNDCYLFGSDSAGQIYEDRQAMWQENRANYSGGVYGEPGSELALTVFWQNMEKLNYPFASETLQKLLNKDNTGGQKHGAIREKAIERTH